MNDTAQTLIDQMVAAGGWPEPKLLEAILEQGEATVLPLLEVRVFSGFSGSQRLQRFRDAGCCRFVTPSV